MTRRKGEITGRMNERDYPHLVELPLPPRGAPSAARFLAVLGDNGQLLRIKNEVAPEPDLGAAGRTVNELGENADWQHIGVVSV